jgi:hypothetical protein
MDYLSVELLYIMWSFFLGVMAANLDNNRWLSTTKVKCNHKYDCQNKIKQREPSSVSEEYENMYNSPVYEELSAIVGEDILSVSFNHIAMWRVKWPMKFWFIYWIYSLRKLWYNMIRYCEKWKIINLSLWSYLSIIAYDKSIDMWDGLKDISLLWKKIESLIPFSDEDITIIAHNMWLDYDKMKKINDDYMSNIRWLK